MAKKRTAPAASAAPAAAAAAPLDQKTLEELSAISKRLLERSQELNRQSDELAARTHELRDRAERLGNPWTATPPPNPPAKGK
jgi:uncharacterized coiled-coil protein SlyX